MADKFIDVPANVGDPVILKRFLNELIDKLNGNALVSYPVMYPTGYTGPISINYAAQVGGYTNTILEAAARANAISGDAKNYITGNLTTNVLQNTEDLATITEQLGTFYNDATAAAWYGLTVKSGELISGFTVSGVDTDTTTPGIAGSVFAISADTFTVGRAIEDISDPSELAYVTANGLPYGTMYDTVNGEIIPAFMIEWTGTGYNIFFNGKTEFSNYLTPGTTTIDGSHFTTGTVKTISEDGNYYSVLEGGSLNFYKTGSSIPYKNLKHIQTGTAIATGSTVTLEGFFNNIPNIMVSSNSLATYSKDYPNNSQFQHIGYTNLVGDPDTGVWTFTPISKLTLSPSGVTVGTIANVTSINFVGVAYNTSSTTYTSASVTPTLTTNVSITSGNFIIDYYLNSPGTSSIMSNITFTATIEYSTNGSTWYSGNSVSGVFSIGAYNVQKTHYISLSGLTTGTISANTYYYRIRIESTPVTAYPNKVRLAPVSGSHATLAAQSIASSFVTTGTTILQSGYVNYIAISN